jgi:Sulfotransferase domain
MTASVDVAASDGVAKGRVPDFFIVGHPKSGTTAMYRMLRSYPQLHMPRKEPSFFVPELLTNQARYPRGIADYLSLFEAATPEQRIGESTPSYLWSKTAASRIAAVQPQARIIAILREPTSFLRSLHLQFLRTDVEVEPDFRKALALDEQRAQGRRLPRNSTKPKLLVYSEHVRYVEQLQRYHAAFSADQVLVLIYEDFRADNEATVRRVLRFLDVEDAAPVELIEANPAAGVRFARVNELVRSLYLGRGPGTRAGKGAVKTVTSQHMRHQTIGAVRRLQVKQPPAADGELMRELRCRFRGEVQAVGEYLNRDLLMFWKYDDRVS